VTAPSWAITILVRLGAVDHVLEHLVRLARGAADQAHLFQIVLGLEQVALLRLPHAVVRPCHCVIGIGGERAFVPDFGVVIAPSLKAAAGSVLNYSCALAALAGGSLILTAGIEFRP
jgi:hypothetical protein